VCSVVLFFFSIGPYCMDPYSLYSRKEGTIFEAPFWHENRGRVLEFPYCYWVVQHSVGHSFRGTKLEDVIHLYKFGHVFQGKNCGGLFGVVRYFSWLEM
jgi:hypothetical protein